VGDQLLGVEVVVMAEDLLDDDSPLARSPLAPGQQELGEPLPGRLLDADLAQGKTLGT